MAGNKYDSVIELICSIHRKEMAELEQELATLKTILPVYIEDVESLCVLCDTKLPVDHSKLKALIAEGE